MQYAAGDYRQLLDAWKADASMSRKGDFLDNAPMESFFGSLKNELVHRTRFRSRQEAKAALFEYIAIFYNRMNRTIKEATVKRYYYETHGDLENHLHAFVSAYNYARRLKTLSGLTPFEYIRKLWAKEPDRFIADPSPHTPGLNT